MQQEPKKEWLPKTELGIKVLKGEITLNDILSKGLTVLEPEIVDTLLPEVKEEVIYIGGSPGKGGGSRRTVTKRTVRMHKSGRRFKLSAYVAIGDGKGIIGLGSATLNENRQALEKATAAAKLNIMSIRLGCGSWECRCKQNHSIPFRVSGKKGSVKVTISPAPRGVGLVASSPVKKVLCLTGISDVWVTSSGTTSTRANLVGAVFEALRNLSRVKGI